jgi:ABC-2 type transport system permease protein
MKPAWLVARWEYLIRVRSKLFLFSTLLMPLLILGTVFIPLLLLQQETSPVMTYAVIGESEQWGEEISRYVDEVYRSPDDSPLYLRYPIPAQSIAEQKQLARFLQQESIIAAYLLLSDDFDQSGEAEYHGGGLGRRLEEEQLRHALQVVWTRVASRRYQVDPEVREVMERDIQWKSRPRTGESEAVADEVQIFLAPILHVLILFFAIFLASQMLMRSIITERSNRVIEILLSSISAKDLMTGKILGLGLVGLTQLAVYLLVAFSIGKLGGLEMFGPEKVGYFLVYAVLGYFFFAAVFAALGSMFETEQEAQQVAGLLSLIPILPLVFSVYVMTRPDAMLVRIASIVPPLTPFLMIIRISVSQVPWWEILTTTIVLAIFTFLIMRWSGSIFRATILRPGRVFRFTRISRWLKVS